MSKDTKHVRKRKYKVVFNRRALVFAAMLFLVSIFLLFNPNLEVRLRLFGGVLFFSSIIGSSIIALSYIQAKTMISLMKSKSENSSEEERELSLH